MNTESETEKKVLPFGFCMLLKRLGYHQQNPYLWVQCEEGNFIMKHPFYLKMMQGKKVPTIPIPAEYCAAFTYEELLERIERQPEIVEQELNKEADEPPVQKTETLESLLTSGLSMFIQELLGKPNPAQVFPIPESTPIENEHALTKEVQINNEMKRLQNLNERFLKMINQSDKIVE